LIEANTIGPTAIELYARVTAWFAMVAAFACSRAETEAD
jgi:hypothetical protein